MTYGHDYWEGLTLRRLHPLRGVSPPRITTKFTTFEYVEHAYHIGFPSPITLVNVEFSLRYTGYPSVNNTTRIITSYLLTVLVDYISEGHVIY